MQRIKMRGYATLITGLIIVGAGEATAQSDPAAVGASVQNQLWTTPVLGESFSATRYERAVRTLADGRQVIVKEEDSKVARDAGGRILFDFLEKCPQESPAVPWCGTHQAILFNPAEPSITPWLWGANAGPAATVLRMTPPQLLAATRIAEAKTQSAEPACTAATVASENLGRQLIEGVPVTGTRTVTTMPAGCAGNDAPIRIVREAWTSAELKLDMRVVVKDPRNGETISGLKDLSWNPDPAVFRPPDGYSVTYSDQGREFAEPYLEQLAKVGVQ